MLVDFYFGKLLVLLETWREKGKRSFQEDSNTTFGEAFFGTPPKKKSSQKISRNLSIKHAYFRINAYF